MDFISLMFSGICNIFSLILTPKWLKFSVNFEWKGRKILLKYYEIWGL
jgi:hypothetical protein